MTDENGATEALTAREVEVLKLIATGLSTKQIAHSLGIAFKTAACHRSRVMAKLDIHEVANLTRYAIRNGYVDAGERDQPSGRQTELYERVTVTEAKYRDAMKQYGLFLRERESIGLPNPDGTTRMRRLRQVEEQAHREYQDALVALREHLTRQ